MQRPLTVASVSVGLVQLSREIESRYWTVTAALGVAGTLTYPIRGPIFHLGHGNKRDAMASLGVRVAAPMAGFYVGIIAGTLYAEARDDPDILGGLVGGAVWGTVAGMLAGGIIDSWVIARRPRPVLASNHRAVGVTVTPTAEIREMASGSG